LSDTLLDKGRILLGILHILRLECVVLALDGQGRLAAHVGRQFGERRSAGGDAALLEVAQLESQFVVLEHLREHGTGVAKFLPKQILLDDANLIREHQLGVSLADCVLA
jgi:hypothetical protein